jgi:hypothetical protein
MRDSSGPSDRRELVELLLASAETPTVGSRPWRIEEALAVVAAGAGRLADTAQWWLTRGPCGSAADGLELHLASLGRSGALTFSPDWGVYVVDQWWRDVARARARLLGTDDCDALVAGAAKLNQLEAERSNRLSRKSARGSDHLASTIARSKRF